MKKRAEITVTTLVTVILLVLGFIIVLIVYYQLNWSGKVDREACHQSVIFRGTLPVYGGVKEYVPLKCKTQKVCITTGLIGGECKEFVNEKGVTKVKVSNKEQIERFIAQDIVDCWSMMGEGKVGLFSQWIATTYGFGSVYPSCVICSRIAFDNKNLEAKGIKIEELDVQRYMMTHAIPGETNLSYYQYLSSAGGKMSLGDLVKDLDEVELTASKTEIAALPKDETVAGVAEVKAEDISVVETANPVELNKQPDELAVTFMQISGPTYGEVFRNSMTAALGILGFGSKFTSGSFFTASSFKNPTIRGAGGRYALGNGKIVTKTVLSPFVKVVAVAAIIALGIQQGNIAYNRAVTAGYCGDVSTGGEAREGCSVVRTINYNSTDISQYCSIIESIP